MKCLLIWWWYLFIIIPEESWGICEAKSAGMGYNGPALVRTSENFKSAIENILKEASI